MVIKYHKIKSNILFFLNLIIVFFITTLANNVYGENIEQNISAPMAYEKQQKGKLTIFDIRTIEEWHNTGVATGAKLITMHHPKGPLAFLDSIKTSVKGNLNEPIAVICASGNRSSWAQKFLTANGFTNITNIEGGMSGRGSKIGWIAKKLPITILPKKTN